MPEARRCLALAASPTVRRVVAGTLLRGFCMSVLFVAAQAALGDLFKSQPQLYGRFVSLFMMTMPGFSGEYVRMGFQLKQ